MIKRTVVVVEDENFLRGLIASSLTQAGFTVHEAADARHARKLLQTIDPDVAVLDIDLGPGPTGLDIGEALLAQSTKTAVVYLTMLNDPRLVGANNKINPRAAYLNKRLIGDTQVLLEAIEAVVRETDLSPFRDDKRADLPLNNLSATQIQVLTLIAQGKTNQQIASIRDRSLSATEGTISRTFAAMGIDPTSDQNARILAVRAFLSSIGRTEIS